MIIKDGKVRYKKLLQDKKDGYSNETIVENILLALDTVDEEGEDEEDEEEIVLPPYRRHKFKVNMDTWIDGKAKGHGSSLVKMHNATDNLCMSRALVWSKARHEHLSNPEDQDLKTVWNNVRLGDANRYSIFSQFYYILLLVMHCYYH